MTTAPPVRERAHHLWTRLRLGVGRLVERARAVEAAARAASPATRAVLIASLGVAAVAVGFAALSRPSAPPGVALASVSEGPFEVRLVEAGSLQALRSVSYSSSIQSNQAKIVFLAPEGKLVEAGDLLVQFDPAPFQEEIRRNQALLEQAQADLEKARQDLKLQRIANEEDLGLARQKLERSRLELRDVEQGKGAVKQDESVAAVASAERALHEAERNFEDLRPLLAQGFITRLELDRAEQQVAKAREELTLARRRHEALMEYGRPLELSQARAEALLTGDSVRQLEAAAESRLEQRRAAIAAAQSRIDEASSKLAQAKQQLGRTEVLADVPGIVVYRKVFFGSEQRRPQVGDQVWANQPLLILPDVSRMVVETQIRETDVHKIAEGQPVRVRVEAYPDLDLAGNVTLVGTLAQEERGRRGTKFFGVTVDLDDSDPRLRPGMTARVEITTSRLAHALWVPLEAVFERGGRTVAYVAERGGLRPREVVLGPSNQDFVVIEHGLVPGERVALVDPERSSEAAGAAP